jgi:uncharacterized protein (UPF0335 family)
MSNTPTPTASTDAVKTPTPNTTETQKLVFETLGDLLARVERLEREAVTRREDEA